MLIKKRLFLLVLSAVKSQSAKGRVTELQIEQALASGSRRSELRIWNRLALFCDSSAAASFKDRAPRPFLIEFSMDEQRSVCVICSLKADYLIREVDTDTFITMCQFHGIKEIVTTHRICELCTLHFHHVLLKSSRDDWEDSISISECIQKTVEAQTQNSTEGQRMDFCWLKSLLREIQKEAYLKELQIPKRTSLSLIRCIPLLPIDHHYSLSLFLTDVLRNWVILENYLDVCTNVERFGKINEESIAREFTWEIFKVTEELKRIALMISDQTLYCVNSRVLTGLELCTETVDLLRSRFLTTEEVASCTNALSSYQYFSELTDSTHAFKLITVLNGYSSLLRSRYLDLPYEDDSSRLRYFEYSTEDAEYEGEKRSSYIRSLQKYAHLCPSHPDFKVALGMLAAYFELPAFLEWAEELQADVPLNDSLSLFLDSLSARITTAPELMYACRERFQDNYVMNRILLAKWLSLISNNQAESLEDLFRSESLAAPYPHLLTEKKFQMHLCMSYSLDALPLLQKTAEIMKHEPKFANKCAICYLRQAGLLAENQGSQLEIDGLTYRAAKVSNNWEILESDWELVIYAYLSAQRFADFEHFVIFSNQVFPKGAIDSCLKKLRNLYLKGPIVLTTLGFDYYIR